MSAPSVSFVVPVHDGAPYLAECLASILGQTVAPLEVLVVDDGSMDRSGDIARSFGRPVRVPAPASRRPSERTQPRRGRGAG
jgi:glycosyltransferase involved in cell wall biosynthesis